MTNTKPTTQSSTTINRMEISQRDLKLDEIVGQDEAVKELKRFVDELKNKSLYTLWDKTPPRGLLLNGPTGVGKTASVRAVAREVGEGVVIVELKYTEIASKF